MNYYKIQELAVKNPFEGVHLRVVPGEKMTMAIYRLEPGAGVPEHSHPHEQMGIVLKGSLELKVVKEKRILREGDVYHIPSNVTHCGKSGEDPAEIIEIFSPPRDDLVKI